MSKPTSENIATVIDGFEQFLDIINKTQSFNLKEFVNFMELRFTAAGYRETPTLANNKILILTEVAAGDFLVATGAIREVRRIYPAAHITLLVHSRTFEFAEYCPYVDEVVLLPLRHSIYNLPDAYKFDLELAQILLEQRFDICFAFVIHPLMLLLMFMSGAKVRVTSIDYEKWTDFNNSIGLAELLMRLATHLFPCSTYGYHRADRFFSLLENLLHVPIANRKLEMWCSPADIEVAKSYLRKATGSVYCLGMGGTRMQSHYPPEKYARLLKMIFREEPTATFVILGGGDDDMRSAAIIKDIAPELYARHVIDLTNKVTYRQSAAVLSLCDVHIGNDTGTIHVAAAVDCPVLEPICFPADLPMRNTDCPRRWHPYFVPSVVVQPERALPECREKHAYRGCTADFPHCITQIEPSTLLRGFHLLQERIAQKICEPLYIC